MITGPQNLAGNALPIHQKDRSGTTRRAHAVLGRNTKNQFVSFVLYMVQKSGLFWAFTEMAEEKIRLKKAFLSRNPVHFTIDS